MEKHLSQWEEQLMSSRMIHPASHRRLIVNFRTHQASDTAAVSSRNTDFTMGWRRESCSDAGALRRLAVRLFADFTGAPVTGGSELRLEEDPVMTRSLCSKKNAASSGCFGYEEVVEGCLPCGEPPC
ncbi:hypothetical protein EYF80_015995 [Liparis tanakae]|uniref:Uncharacterized protein n=1 Tax=Liparis tanakae TaxID=230148 RepID=A0A4Z2I6W6_9TELE|nr:hypothetical protein EYF80_015995 [Liparis tanakae]